MSKLKTNEIIEHARFLVAYGDELEHEQGYEATVQALLDKAEDKVEALVYVIGIMSRAAVDLLSRSEENAKAAERYQKRRAFLESMARNLAAENLELAEKEGDDDRAARLRAWADADMVTRGYLLTMPTGAVKERSDYQHRRWAEQVLTATTLDDERKKRITDAVNAHDEPLLATRMLILAGTDRVKHLDSIVKELTAAKKREEDVVSHVKTLAERRLKKVDGEKQVDSLGGWIRITKRDTAIAVSPEWDGKGRPKDPDPDKLPEEYVKIVTEPKKAEIVKVLKAIEKAKDDRAKLARKLEKAVSDDEKAEIKAAIEAIEEPPSIMGAKLYMKPSQFIATSK